MQIALKRENAELRRKSAANIELVGTSSAFNEIRNLVDRVAQMERVER